MATALMDWTQTNYGDGYLKSDHWIRTRNVRRNMAFWAGNRFCCEWCGTLQPKHLRERHVMDRSRSNIQVHHLTYDNIGHERFDDLLVVCAECHKALHDFIDQMEAKGHDKKYVMRRLKPYCVRRMLRIYQCWDYVPRSTPPWPRR